MFYAHWLFCLAAMETVILKNEKSSNDIASETTEKKIKPNLTMMILRLAFPYQDYSFYAGWQFRLVVRTIEKSHRLKIGKLLNGFLHLESSLNQTW